VAGVVVDDGVVEEGLVELIEVEVELEVEEGVVTGDVVDILVDDGTAEVLDTEEADVDEAAAEEASLTPVPSKSPTKPP
jgi:hypothetical protein